MRLSSRLLVVGGTIACVAAIAGCGGSDKKSSGGTGSSVKGKQGGDLTVLYGGDVDYLDPAAAYYQYSFNIVYALQRPLYSFTPAKTDAIPDLATGPAKVSSDGKTVTVTIRPGVKFSPPVNRAATSKDVKYAIERGFLPSVASGYASAYFGDVTGVKAYTSKKAKEISGIQTPDDQTIVFKLDRGSGSVLAGALALPMSAPVPKEWAQKYDQEKTSKYFQHLVTTGPYMVQNDAKGNTIGYKPGRLIKMVRNPNWDKATDYKPAYLDTITVKEGNGDPALATRQILSGRSMVQGDYQIPPDVLKQLQSGAKRAQLIISPPTGRVRYVAFNTTIKPFDNVNVRKAAIAVIDRNAMRLAFGGPLAGDIPTHYLSPGLPGFEEAGGTAGPGVDVLAKPGGDLALAQSYMRKAGFKSGKYDGNAKLLMVADVAGNQLRAAQVALNGLNKLGFKITFRAVVRDTMLTKFCNLPRAKVAICPNVGWLKDFPDAQTVLDPTFNGKNILPVNNNNWPQLDDPNINTAMDKAELIVDPAERAKAWGAIDKQVTEASVTAPWLWDRQPNAESSDVNGVLSGNNATWDFTFTSLK